MNKLTLNDDEIKSLLEELVRSQEVKKYIMERADAHKRYKLWIDPGRLDSIPNNELKERFLEYFNEGAGRHKFIAIYRDRIIKDIKNFRTTLKFLLEESIPIETRLNESWKGKQHITGFGRALVTSILMDFNLNEYSTWNKKTIMGLASLGLTPKFERGENSGERYKKIMDAVRHIRDLTPGISFLDVDYFLHWVAAEEDGKKAIRTIKNRTYPKYPITTEEDILQNTKRVYKSQPVDFDESEKKAVERERKQITYEQNWDAQERANKNHRRTLQFLSKEIKRYGVEPLQSVIDLFAEKDTSVFIFEVKSIHTDNFIHQTRMAIGQLLDYAYFQVRSKPENSGKTVLLGIVYNKKPPQDIVDFLRHNDFYVFWKEEKEIEGEKESKKQLDKFLEG